MPPIARLAIFVLAVASCAGVARAASLRGTFALQHATPHSAARLDVTATADPLAKRLVFTVASPGSQRPIDRYDVDMTKLMHVVIVSDDFTSFAHVHPTFAPDGRFTIVHRFPGPGLFHVYADSVPHGIGQQVFRFDLQVGAARSNARDVRPGKASVVADSYAVTLSDTRLRVGAESRLRVCVLKNGTLADDMQTYLGAAAHAVFLNARDLTYVHVHPLPTGKDDGMTMDGMSMGAMSMPAVASPDMTLHVDVREPGTYALWLQFRAGGALHVAPFVLTAV
jgi:hypothetical protein